MILCVSAAGPRGAAQSLITGFWRRRGLGMGRDEGVREGGEGEREREREEGAEHVAVSGHCSQGRNIRRAPVTVLAL